jgi:hypothetical protein
MCLPSAWVLKRGDREVTQPTAGTRSVCQKINYIEIRKEPML